MVFCIFLLVYKKVINTSYYDKKKYVLLNRAKDYYENEKEKLRNLSEGVKNKKREFGKNRYHKTSEEKKQKLKEYQKNYRMAKMSQ